MAEVSGEHVVRGGKTGGLNQYHYNACSDSPMCGWSTCGNDGEVGSTGEGGDGFSAAMGRGNNGASQPGSQT